MTELKQLRAEVRHRRAVHRRVVWHLTRFRNYCAKFFTEDSQDEWQRHIGWLVPWTKRGRRRGSE